MTKIASSKPEAIRRPVYVDNNHYEIWYARPVSLGIIEKRGDYWYTPDGMRFIASRDAMAYLCRLSDLGHTHSSGLTAADKAKLATAISGKGVASRSKGKGKGKLRKGSTSDTVASGDGGKGQESSAPSPDMDMDEDNLMTTIVTMVKRYEELQKRKH